MITFCSNFCLSCQTVISVWLTKFAAVVATHEDDGFAFEDLHQVDWISLSTAVVVDWFVAIAHQGG